MRSEKVDNRTKKKLLSEIDELIEKNRLLEQRVVDSEQTLEAIRSGEVDAILVTTKTGDKIFTLKGAEEPYRILFEQMNEGALTISEDGGILYANQSFAGLMRSSLEKIFGSNIEDFLGPDDITEFRNLLYRSTRSPVRDRFEFRTRDGTLVPIQLSVSYLPKVDVPTYCIVAADLTERIQWEEKLNRSYGELEVKVQERTSELLKTTRALEETKARLETVLTKMPVAVVIIEPPDGKVVFINDEVNRQFRRNSPPDSNDIFSQYSTYHLDGSRYDTTEYPMTRAMLRGETVLNEIIEFERADGTRGFANTNAVPVQDSRGNVTAVIGLRFEITEQVEAEKALQVERNRLQFILDSLPVGVIVTDMLNRPLIMNKVIKDIIQTSQGSVRGSLDIDQFVGYLPGNNKPLKALDWPVAQAIRTGAMSTGQEIELEKDDGTRMTILCFARPINEDDASIGGIAAFVDVTDQKNAERALAHSNQELQQFAYVASHDLQEPLRMVISYLSLLEKRYSGQLDETAKDYIGFAVNGGKRMKALIDDLLEYSRLDTMAKPEVPLDMNKVASDVLMNLELPIEDSQAEIVIDILPTIKGDDRQMDQVLQNLVSNALKFHGNERPVIHISCTDDRDYWIFSVKDNGIGLNMEYADRIFQMFQRLHSNEKYEGTGVGLAIVKKIVERHGGRVWVESEEGKGATFYFSLPKIAEGHVTNGPLLP